MLSAYCVQMAQGTIQMQAHGLFSFDDIPFGDRFQNALDTHWIWQEGTERLTKEPLQIIGGEVQVPQAPGLGVAVDMDRIDAAHDLYKKISNNSRDDAIAMRYLLPNFKYHPKRPSMVRGEA